YFTRYFGPDIVTHIAYQTNLYATKKDINTTFTINENEIMKFLSILMYMGISELPAVEDYWAMETRVPQVANLMSSKRFRLLKRVVHFNDNTELPGSIDRFFKIRPLFSFLNSAFRREPQTPKQASADGFIHDMVLYQGKTTLEAHGVPLTPEQQAMGATSQIVSVLASTMSSPSTTAIFADNFFTSLELVRYLRDQNCRTRCMTEAKRTGALPGHFSPSQDVEARPRQRLSRAKSQSAY
ncbi:PiggyBac transposable element-derived protein 2, partial [Dissostichus eleginoides]